MENILFILISIMNLFFDESHASVKEQKNSKEERIYEHSIKMGSIDTARVLRSIRYYNERNKLIEEVEYSYKNSINSIKGKTTYKYNSEDKLIEKTEYDSDRIRYKKIYEYNRFGKKSLVKVYYTSETNSQDLSLWAAMRIYYNDFNKPSVKKWVGGINQYEEETLLSRSSVDGKLSFSKTDSSIAIYHYGKNRKIDTIKVFVTQYKKSLLNKNVKDLSCDEMYIYQYDRNDSLIQIKKPSSTIYYTYKEGKLFEEKEESNYEWTLTKIYTVFNEYEEISYSVPTNENLNYRKKFEYNENNELIKQTNYDYLNEPTYCQTSSYTYY